LSRYRSHSKANKEKKNKRFYKFQAVGVTFV